jgi:hypothetical protein
MQLDSGAVTVVAEDPDFVHRFRTYLTERFRNHHDLRVYAVDDVAENEGLTANSTVLYTRAARKRLNAEEYHLLPHPIAFMSDRAARKILQCMLATHGQRVLQLA